MTAPWPNPLIAERVDTTPWYAGITLVEGIVDVKNGIESDSWVSTTIGTAFAAVDGALLYLDPLGQMGSWIVAMCIEHIDFLSEALDWLAGDPDQVAANAATWRNVAANTRLAADEFRAAVWRELPQWSGASADVYRAQAEVELLALQGYAEAADAKGSAVDRSGIVVQIVRTVVRDLIADFVSTLVIRSQEWSAEVALTLGGATPWVAAQISGLAAKWALRIAKVVDGLIRSIDQLVALLRKVDEYTEGINARPRASGLSPDGTPYPGGHPRDLDGDGRPDALDPDRDGDGVLDPPIGGGSTIPPLKSGLPDKPTTPLMPRYAGETDAATATRIFGTPSNGVRYLTPEQAEGYRVFVRDGQLYDAQGRLVDTSGAGTLHQGGGGRAIFVMDSQGNLYLSTTHSIGDFHHSSFLAGRPVSGAGEMVVENGRITLLTDRSGHYQPTVQFREQVLDELEADGMDVSGITLGTW